jgi:tetratricopeptide (TPR) repeat protein
MTAVALPLSMLAVDYYFDRKLSMKLIYEKWLYFLLSLVTGIIGLYFARVEGLSEVNKAVPILKRIFIGSYSYIVYIVKSVVPYEMVPIYPFPDILDWTFYASMVIALFIFGSIYYFFLNKKKIAVFGLMFFTVNIMFLLQFKIAGKGFLSDRYTYIAYLGLFFVYAFALERILGKYGRQFDKLIYLAALLIIGVSGYMNFEQNMIWKNSETLWSHELKYYDQDPFVWYQRASYYNDNEKLNEALFDYSKSIALNTFNPNAYLNRGIIYARFNMLEKALQDFSAAEKLDPANPKIYLNRAIVYINLARSDKAQSELEKYLALRPNDPDMWSNLGTLRRKNKQYKKSLYAFNRAIQINPDNLVYYNARIKTYYEMGDIKRASDDLNFLKSKGSTGINPDYEAMINQEK